MLAAQEIKVNKRQYFGGAQYWQRQYEVRIELCQGSLSNKDKAWSSESTPEPLKEEQRDSANWADGKWITFFYTIELVEFHFSTDFLIVKSL